MKPTKPRIICRIDGTPVYFDSTYKSFQVTSCRGPKYPGAEFKGYCYFNGEKMVQMDGADIVHPEPDKVGIYETKFYIVGTTDIEKIKDSVRLYNETRGY